MSSGAETPRKRRGKGRKSSPASGSNPGTATAAVAGGGGGGGGGGVGDGGSFTSPSPSAKKLKIFDYFGAGAPSTPQAPKESARKDSGSGGTGGGGGRKRLGETEELNKTAPKPTMTDYCPVEQSQAAASPPAPTWGKMVDPRKARRWEMLRCFQEGGGGGGGRPVDPTAWARRSYSLNYAPLFQDARTPGMGSTGVGWGWASHSQVFGGARAFMAPNSALDSLARRTAAKSNTGSDVQEQELDPGQRRSADEDDCASAIREGLGHPEGVESETSRRIDATTVAATAAAAAAGAAGAAKAEGVTAGKTRRQLQQLRNFEVMISWLTSALSRTPTPAARLGFPPSEVFSTAAGAASTEGAASAKSLLEVALERQDGGPAIAFMALRSLAPQASEAEEGTEDNPEGECRPVALALRFYHAGSTWQRVSRWPTPRRRGQGPGSRLHPDDPALAAAVDEADYSERLRRSSADFSAAVALLNAGLATPLLASAHGTDFFGGGGGDGGGSVCFGRGGGGSGGGGGVGKYISDPLAALAPREVLTAIETRSLTKALGIPPTIARESRSGGGGGGGGGTNGAPGPVRGRREAGGRSGSGVGERATVDSKDEACLAFEQWLVRPTDLAKKKARLTRAVRQMADLVAGGGALADRTGRGSSGGGGSGGDDCDGVCIIRLADDAREAIHRVHVAFFAAARHGPHDVPAVLREDLTRVLFGSASRHGGSGGGGGRGGRNGKGEDGKGAVEVARCRHPAAPQILSSVEAFTEYYRLITLADVMDFAASAGDSGLAYGSLHEASTALLPSGCPLCRCHNQSRCRGDGDGGGGGGGGGGAGAVGDDQDVTAGEHPPPPPPPPRCCDICELSARVVMRGVGLMERDKDYDNAFHYLEILLQAPSQRLSVLRPRYWQRLVTDLCHKKRFTEALRACEKALAEALPAPVQGNKTGVPAPVDATRTPSGTNSKGRRGSDGVLMSVALAPVPSAVPVVAAAAAAAASAAAAVFPLGESLPLLRRAVRLAVPPLRWRKRPPPQLRKACLRVMRMDLSWRRAGGGGGSGGSGSVNVSSSVSGSGDGIGSGHGGGKGSGRGRGSGNGSGKSGDRRGEYSSMMVRRDIFGGPAVSSPGSGLRAGQGQGEAGVDAIVIDGEEEDEEEKIEQEQKQKDGREQKEGGGEEEGGRGGEQENGGVLKAERDSEDSPKVALGTSLEQAVLDKMLAELGPGWTGLHSENSICLGLFALLCWDALFAPSAPAAAGSAVAPARPQIDTQPTSDTSEESSDTRARRSGGVGPPQQGGGNGATSGCRGEDERRRASVAVRQVPPPPLVGGDAQGRTVEVCGGSPVADCLEASDAQILREEEDSAFEHDHPFPSPYQSEPVDLMTVAFAGRRRHLLEGVFASVEQGRGDALIRRTWLRHYGEACTGLNWNLFADGVEGWVTVACAIGPLPLSGICRNLASNYWAWRHGLPDLFLWRKDAANTANSVALNAPAGPTAPVGSAASAESVAPADSLPAEGKGGPAGSSPAQGKGRPVGPDTSSRAKGKGGPAGSSPAGLNGGPAGTLPVEGNGGPTPETCTVVVDVDAEPSLPTTAVANIHDIYDSGRGARVADSGKAAEVYAYSGTGAGAGSGTGTAVAMGGTFCKWVEVKGPGDDLSCAQEAWIDTLVGAGAEAVLLRVEDTATAAAAATNVAAALPRR